MYIISHSHCDNTIYPQSLSIEIRKRVWKLLNATAYNDAKLHAVVWRSETTLKQLKLKNVILTTRPYRLEIYKLHSA